MVRVSDNRNDLIEQIRKAEDALYSDAWNQLVGAPDDLLTDLLVDKIKALHADQYEPNRERARQFLSTYLEQIMVTLPLTVPKMSHNEVRSWIQILIKFYEILSKIGSNQL